MARGQDIDVIEGRGKFARDAAALLERYAPLGRWACGQLALPPEQAVALADDLAERAVAVLGFHCWREVDGGTLVEVLEVDNDTAIEEPGTRLEAGLELVQAYIPFRLPPTVDLVSLTLDVDPVP